MTADRIDLIDEDQAGAVLLGPFEQVPHPAGADAHKHLDEFRSGEREKGHARFPCDRFCQQGFAGARGTNQQHTLGDFGAYGCESLRSLEEGHHFLQVLLGLLHPGHVVKLDTRLSLHGEAGLGLTKLHCLAGATGHPAAPAGQEHQRADQQQGEEKVAEQAEHRRGALGRVNVKTDPLLLEVVHQLGGNPGQIYPQPLHPVVQVGIHRLDHSRAAAVIDVNCGHPAGIDVIEEAAVTHAGYRRIARSLVRSIWVEAGRTAVTKQLPAEEGHHGQRQQPESN